MLLRKIIDIRFWENNFEFTKLDIRNTKFKNPQESSYFEFLWVLFLILKVFLKRQTIKKHDLKLGSAGIWENLCHYAGFYLEIFIETIA